MPRLIDGQWRLRQCEVVVEASMGLLGRQLGVSETRMDRSRVVASHHCLGFFVRVDLLIVDR